MAQCKGCGSPMDWGYDSVTQRWIPLESIETHDDLEKSFVDENGILRADHRDRHEGRSGVNVIRLDKKVPAEVLEKEATSVTPIRRTRKTTKKATAPRRTPRKAS